MNLHIEALLRSDDPERRKQAIRAMAKGEAGEPDEAMLRRLVAIYKNDPDPEVQQLALAAGKRLRRQTQEMAALMNEAPKRRTQSTRASTDTQPKRRTQSTRASTDTKPKRRTQAFGALSDSKPKRPSSPPLSGRSAQVLLEEAVGAVVMADYDSAIELVREAYAVDPNIIDNDKHIKIIATAYRLPARDALYELGVPPEKLGGKRKRHKRDTFELTFLDALLWGGIYGVASALLTLITYLVLLVLANELDGAFVVASVIAAGAALLYSTLVWLVVNFVLHFIATLVFNGDGTFAGLMRAVTPMGIGYTALSFVFQAYLLYITPTALETFVSLDVVQMSSLNIPLDPFTLLVIFLVPTIIAAFHYAYSIGLAYDFGFDGGCKTLMFIVLFIPCSICAAYTLSLFMDLGSLAVS